MVKKDQQETLNMLEQQKSQFCNAFNELAASMRKAAHEAEMMATMWADPNLSSETKAAFQQRNSAALAQIMHTANPAGQHLMTAPISPASDDAPSPVTASKKRGRASTGGAAAPGEEKEKRKRKPKDPNAPKRPASAYILFQNDVRKAMTLRYPEKPYRELLTEISKEWSQLDPARKADYQAIVDKGKAKYNVQKAAYDVAHGQPATPVVAPLPVPVQQPTMETSTSDPDESTSDDTDEDSQDDSDEEEEDDQAPATKKFKGPAAPPIATVQPTKIKASKH